MALWTILKSEKDEEEITYRYKPHPVQITAILLLLKMEEGINQNKLRNRLAEVKTG